MTKLIVFLITLYHSILQVIGTALGMLTAGFFVGYMSGVRKIKDMYKYMLLHTKAREIALRKQREAKRNGNENNKSEGPDVRR